MNALGNTLGHAFGAFSKRVDVLLGKAGDPGRLLHPADILKELIKRLHGDSIAVKLSVYKPSVFDYSIYGTWSSRHAAKYIGTFGA